MSNKHLTILLNRLARHTHTHTHKEMGPVGLYSALQPGRIGELEGQSLAGYLSASCGFFETSEPGWDQPHRANQQAQDHGPTIKNPRTKHSTNEARTPGNDRRPRPQTTTTADQRAKSKKAQTTMTTTHTKSNGDPFLLRQFQPNSSEHSGEPSDSYPSPGRGGVTGPLR